MTTSSIMASLTGLRPASARRNRIPGGLRGELRKRLGLPTSQRRTPPGWLLAVLGLGAALVLVLIGRWLLWPRWKLPVREITTDHPIDTEQPEPVPVAAQGGDLPLQLTHDGAGPLFHRRYRVDIAHPQQSIEALMQRIRADLNLCSPTYLARFEKVKGDPADMVVGDDYFIHIPGPWNGPVRVIDVTPTSFSLLTLEGHLEAGEIRLRFVPHPEIDDAIRFEILSWARSRNLLVDLAYDKLHLAQMAQTNMWVHFCQRVVEESGGERIGEIDVITERLPFEGEVIPSG